MGPRHVSAFALAPRAASANAGAPYSKPLGVLPGPVTLRPSPVIVEREELDVDCVKEGESECTFTATYFLRNPRPTDVYPVGNSSGSHVEGSFLTTLSF